MNAVLQKPRAKTSSGASYGSDWASVHGRNFAIRPSHFALRRRRRRSFALRTSPFDLPRSGDADGASDVENPYTFTARRWDAESGLMQYRNRYYDPRLGRFVSRDPAGHADEVCLYQIVLSRPTVGCDPYGLRAAFSPRVRNCIKGCKKDCREEYGGWNVPQRWACISYCDNACTGQPDTIGKTVRKVKSVCRVRDAVMANPLADCVCGVLQVTDIAFQYDPSSFADMFCSAGGAIGDICSAVDDPSFWRILRAEASTGLLLGDWLAEADPTRLAEAAVAAAQNAMQYNGNPLGPQTNCACAVAGLGDATWQNIKDAVEKMAREAVAEMRRISGGYPF